MHSRSTRRGRRKPSAAVVSLLRILEVFPEAFSILGEGSPSPVPPGVFIPFKVTGAEIASLKPERMSEMLHRLLFAEALRHGLPMDKIRVSSQITTPDGGEDGRISWQGDPPRTRFLPSRLCQFQLKARKISPSQASKEVCTSEGVIRPMIRSILENGGHYIMLCTKHYNQQLIERRENAILNSLEKAGLVDMEDFVSFWGADEIAAWVNFHQAVALWVREEAGLGTLGGFVTWKHWSGRSEHSVSWVEDPRLAELSKKLRGPVTKSRTALQVVGLSGIGKSRLCLEALGRFEKSDTSGLQVRDFVMYAELSKVDAKEIYSIVEKLAISGARAVVVVDDCDPQTHTELGSIVSRTNSCLSLITISTEIPSRFTENIYKVDEAPLTVIEPIISNVAVGLKRIDQERLARLAQGFPEVCNSYC